MKMVAITGKLGSGKSEIVIPYQREGYKLIKFADTLKDLVCMLINVDREFIEDNKDEYKEYSISYETLADKLDLDITDITSIRESNKYNSIREILQFIGTDIIRKYNPNWHVEKLKEKLVDNTNYCIDDLRFLNENKFIEEVGGVIIRIIRENRDTDKHGISHASETEQDKIVANYTVINSGTLEELHENINDVMEKISNDN